MEPDDERLADSLKLAYEAGMEVLFVPKSEKAEHPNSVKMLLKKRNTKAFSHWHFDRRWQYPDF